MQYIYDGNYAIGYMDGNREIYFSAPIPAYMLIND